MERGLLCAFPKPKPKPAGGEDEEVGPEPKEERSSEGSELVAGAGRELLSRGLTILHKTPSLQRTGVDGVRWRQ